MSFKKLFNILSIVGFIGLLGCTHGYCPDPLTKRKPKVSNVWVYKYDQSKQCDTKPGVSIEDMMKDFNDLKVTVLESKKQFDGLMRIQACGAFTGMANMFLISKEDFDKASSRGYQRWDFESVK